MSSGPTSDAGRSAAARGSADAGVAAARLIDIAKGLPALDRLAALTAQLLRVESAQVSMLADVQHVVGGAGLATSDVRQTTTPLSDSLCAVAVRSARPLVVTDARADARVAALPPVTSGTVGSYLGVPMTVSGVPVGALCAFGPDARDWTPEDVALLEQLSEWAVTELELASLARSFETDRERFEQATHAAGIGSFDWDMVSRTVQADARMLELFGVEPQEAPVPAAAFRARVHPEDDARVEAAVAEAVATLGDYRAEYRIGQHGGGWRWVRARGRVMADDRGRAVRLIGSALDTTDENDADGRAVRVLESMSVAFISLDHDWRMTYVNAEAEALVAQARGDLLGKSLFDVFPLARGTIFEERYRAAVATGRPQTFEAYYGAPLDTWLEVRALPSAEGLSLYFLDVTERHEAQELAELSHDVSERLSLALDPDRALQDLVRAVVPRLADWAVVSVVQSGGGLHDVARWHDDPVLLREVEAYAGERYGERQEGGMAEEVARSGERSVVPEAVLGRALTLLRSPRAIAAITALRPQSAVLEPLRTGGGAGGGCLTLVRGVGRPPMSDAEMAVAASIAQRASMALDNARLFAEQRATATRLSEANLRLRQVADHQLTVARALQEAMLTRLPEPDHLEMAARYITASADEKVGGDWYDAVVLPGGETLVTIGDVVGHDIHAAAAMGQLRNMLRMVAWDRDEPPHVIVGRLDRALEQLKIDTLATLLTLRIEQDAAAEAAGLRTLRWTSAGHPAPVLVHADGTAELLDQQADLLLGVASERARHDNVHSAPPDSTLIIYTDGLIETRRRDIATGQQELLVAAAARHTLPLDDLVDGLIAELVGSEPADDVAVLAVRFHDEDKPKPV